MEQLPHKRGAAGPRKGAKGSTKNNLTGSLYQLFTCIKSDWPPYSKSQEKQTEFELYECGIVGAYPLL